MAEAWGRTARAGDVTAAVTPAVREMLDVDPADLASWLPAVAAGDRVLLPDVPGSLPLAREAVAFGVVALVPDPTDPEQLAEARQRVLQRDVPEVELAALTTVLRRRLADGRGGHPDPRTAPRALLVAFNKQELSRTAATCARLERWGAPAFVLTSTTLLRSGRGVLPAGATVLAVPDPGGAWWPSRIERLLVLRGPRLVTGGAHRALGLLARRGPGAAGRLARRALPTAAAVNTRRSAVTLTVHRRAWAPIMVRVKPALVARATIPRLPELVGDLRDLDAVCAPGADSLTLVWRLLRALPELRAISSMSGHAIAEVVRERTLALAER